VVGLLFLAAAIVSLHVDAHPVLSQFDETLHVDYLYKAARGDVVQRGEYIGQRAAHEAACRGIDWPEFVPPPCGVRPYNVVALLNLGYNTADVHPPTYYFLTAWLSAPFTATGASLVTIGRLVGMLWLGSGLVLTWIAGRRIKIGAWPLAAALVLIATTPSVIHASSIVSPDATSLFGGALVLIATVSWEQRTWPTWALLASGFLAGMLRSTNLLAVLAGCGYLLVRAIQARKDRPVLRRTMAGVVGLGASGIVALVGWFVVREVVAITGPVPIAEWFGAPRLEVGDLVAGASALVTPVQNALVPAFLATRWVPLVQVSLHWMMALTSVATFAFPGMPARLRSMAMGGIVGMTIGGLGLVALQFLVFGIALDVPTRYGLSLLPVLGVVVAGASDRRFFRWVPVALAGFSLLIIGVPLIEGAIAA